ncbi:hypothetical protein ACHAXR_013415 [Thalassiosira sp. AJA248-18]
MRTSPVLPSSEWTIVDYPDATTLPCSMGQDQKEETSNNSNDNDDGGILLKRHNSKKVLSSLFDSAKGLLLNNNDDGLIIPSATSECSIATEYNNGEGGQEQLQQQQQQQHLQQQYHHEESRQDDYEAINDWYSVTTTEEANTREGVSDDTARDVDGIELKRERAPSPLSVALKKIAKTVVVVKRENAETASSEGGSKSSSKSSKKSSKGSKKQTKNLLGLPPRQEVKREESGQSSKDVDTKKKFGNSKKKTVQHTKQDVPKTPSSTTTKQQKQKQKQKKPVTKDTTAAEGVISTQAPTTPATNDHHRHWTGHIIGLRLPSNIDSDFDTKNKPTDRRVDPSKFLVKKQLIVDDDDTTTVRSSSSSSKEETMQHHTNDDDHWAKWKTPKSIANIALDIHLVSSSSSSSNPTTNNNNNDSEPSSEPIKVRMIRDPNEDISKTLQRLQLTVQKKLGGKKKKHKKPNKKVINKGDDAEYGATGKQGDDDQQAVLWRKKPTDDGKTASVDLQPTTVSSLPRDKTLDTDTLLDGFYNAMLPINVCNPWSDNDVVIIDEPKSVAVDIDVLSKNVEAAATPTEEKEGQTTMDNSIMKGYEHVEYTNSSLTINEVLHRAANMTNLNKYALSVPITVGGKSTTTSLVVPLLLNSCPPTITSVSTFGSFNETHVFERTPLVVEVSLLYAIKAQFTWFANGEQVSCAASNSSSSSSSCYTPTKDDVGKILTVLIVPQRKNHNGKGCEEAYQFKRVVECLPSLPNLIPMREEFMDRQQQKQQDNDHHEEKKQGDGNEKKGPTSLRQFLDRQRQQEQQQQVNAHHMEKKQQGNHNGKDEENDDSPTSLRIVTYNILADQNASRDASKDDSADRMYSHCNNEHIIKWRRHPLIVHELLAYHPDIISLQEVDTDVYDNYLRPIFGHLGYEGYYSQKGVDETCGVREGCAIFWSLEVFESVRPIDMRTHNFRDMIKQFSCEERMHKSQWQSLADMSDLLDRHPNLKHVLFNKLGHVMQTVVLTRRHTQEKVVVGNTHLYFHPLASHIRCLKMLMACHQLEIEHRENQHCPIIFCGDLNSHPNSGVLKLLLDRYLERSNGRTWKHLCTYEWEDGAGGESRAGGERELHHDVEAIDLAFPPSFPGLQSAYYPNPPEFTHFIEAFVCTLDYILVSNNFVVEKRGGTPTREDVSKKYIAMPNECMPSDHVSLVCDLEWR